MRCDSIHRMIELVLTYVHKTIFKMMRNNGQDLGCISWSFFGVRKKQERFRAIRLIQMKKIKRSCKKNVRKRLIRNILIKEYFYVRIKHTKYE